MSPILDLQKRARELGRIRIGQVVPTTKRDGTPGTRPEKLDRFRLTSASKPLLERVAELYGGEVREWAPQGGGATAWEVITTTNRIPILVPPQPVTQWMEHWQAGGCKRRCDGVTEVLSDSPCICKANEQDLCKPTTRLNVVLRDVEGIGVWRLESKGWNSAIELPDSAAFLSQVGGYVDGFLALEQRTSKHEKADGKIETRHFMVPTIEISVTPAELMAGKGRIQPPALEGPVQQQALPAGTSTDPVVAELAPYYELLADATTSGECLAVFEQAKEANVLGSGAKPHPARDVLYGAIGDKARLLNAQGGSEDPETDEPVDAVVVEDAEVVWQQILAEAGKQGFTLAMVEADFVDRYAIATSAASAGELGVYLTALKNGEAA